MTTKSNILPVAAFAAVFGLSALAEFTGRLRRRVPVARIRGLAAKADKVDLAWLEWRLIVQGVPAEEAARRVAEFRRLMALQAAGVPAVLSYGPLDDTWHEAVLHTHRYAELCKRIAGRFIHHRPGPAPTPRQRALTVFAYGAAFRAEPPGDLWPAADMVELNRIRCRHAVKGPGWSHEVVFVRCESGSGGGDGGGGEGGCGGGCGGGGCG